MMHMCHTHHLAPLLLFSCSRSLHYRAPQLLVVPCRLHVKASKYEPCDPIFVQGTHFPYRQHKHKGICKINQLVVLLCAPATGGATSSACQGPHV